MKKLSSMALAAAVAVMALFTGCDTSETTLVLAANTAGNLGLSAWFAIDAPDASVKEVLKEVVELTTSASQQLADGESYVVAVTPMVQEVVAKHKKLKAAQKNLINTGASVILSGLDTFIATNEKVKSNTELLNKVVAAFGSGCLTAIARSDDSDASQAIAKAHAVIMMKYDEETKAFSIR